jgi:hypothetical protein
MFGPYRVIKAQMTNTMCKFLNAVAEQNGQTAEQMVSDIVVFAGAIMADTAVLNSELPAEIRIAASEVKLERLYQQVDEAENQLGELASQKAVKTVLEPPVVEPVAEYPADPEDAIPPGH